MNNLQIFLSINFNNRILTYKWLSKLFHKMLRLSITWSGTRKKKVFETSYYLAHVVVNIVKIALLINWILKGLTATSSTSITIIHWREVENTWRITCAGVRTMTIIFLMCCDNPWIARYSSVDYKNSIFFGHISQHSIDVSYWKPWMNFCGFQYSF